MLFLIACSSNQEEKAKPFVAEEIPSSPKIHPDSIIKEHLKNGAWKHGLYSNEYQEEIDKGIEKDSHQPPLCTGSFASHPPLLAISKWIP